MSSIIRTENLSYTYLASTPWETKALKNINLEINRGEILGLVGPTGSGKTTLALHFNGLLIPSTGKVFIDNIDISRSDVDKKKIRQKVGMIFQYPEHQLFEETVFDDIAFGPRNLKLPENEVNKRVQEAMELMNLEFDTYKNRSPFSLSGGEMRRVALAGVLAMKPEVLVMDEPTAGLDPGGREELLGKIDDFCRNKGLTVIIISHGMEEIASLADRVIILDEGEIIASGTPREIFLQERWLKEHHLGIPDYTRLMFLLNLRGIKARTDIITIEEAKEEIMRIWS